MRITAAFWLVLVWIGFPSPLCAEEGPAPIPKLDRVDYRKPEEQRALGAALGFGKRGQSIVNQLHSGEVGLDMRLERIVRWVDRNLKFDEVMAARWRPVDQIVKDGTYGSLADRALVIGVFARASGIPVVWVKTLPTAWLIAKKEGRATLREAEGHVFLEMHLQDRWQLFDPVSARLYPSYDPRVRRLPRGQYAYDKGGDPHALVLPNRSELWRAQVASYVAGLDLNSLPWAVARDMLVRWRVYVAGRGGPADYAKATANALGYNVEKCINADWEKILPQVRGKTLIVVLYGRRPSLPKKYWRRFLPAGYEQILSGKKVLPKGWTAHRLSDGTRVILVTASGYGPVELAVSEALEG